MTPGNRTERLGWSVYLVLCGLGLTITLTWLGPRPSEGLGVANTAVFWLLHVAGALGLLALVQVRLGRMAWMSRLPGVLLVLVSGTVASLAFTPVALVIDGLFLPSAAAEAIGDPLALSAAQEFLAFSGPIVLTWLLVNAPTLVRLEPPSAAGPAPSADDPAAELWGRLPKRLGRDLVAMSAELHYLRVYTTAGDALILFSFGRATAALEAYPGMQVHRSHWVALDHVTGIVSENGRTRVQLDGAPDLPVSRPFRPALRAALRQAA
ncbi:hypothetical protein HKCCSP123_18825 [Rhodobacterales bacterium HKCCSP123]|nr:hypothetical protein [Rhodobacterales bacterium HKCCSP123]